MKAIEFKRKGLLYYIHKFGFSQDPDDTCAYKGELMITAMLILLTIHASVVRAIFFLFPSIRNSYSSWGSKIHLLFFLITFLSLLFGHILCEDAIPGMDFIHWHELFNNNEWVSAFFLTFFVMLVGMITLAIISIIIALMVGAVYGIIQIFKWIWKKTSPVVNPKFINADGEPSTQFGVLYYSVKEKWCKRINWEE